MTSTFHTHSSLVYVTWNYVTGIKGLGINETDSWKAREGSTKRQPGLGGAYERNAGSVWVSLRPRAASQGSCARWQWQQPMPSEAWVIGTRGGQPEMRWGLERAVTEAGLTSEPKFLLLIPPKLTGAGLQGINARTSLQNWQNNSWKWTPFMEHLLCTGHWVYVVQMHNPYEAKLHHGSVMKCSQRHKSLAPK